MNPTHHPSDDHWLDFVAGQMDGVNRSLLDAHLAFCKACRQRATEKAAPGGEQLVQSAPEEVSPALLQGILSRLKPPVAPRVGAEVLPLPEILWPLFPNLQQAQWKGALTKGFRFLQMPSVSASILFLIHMEKGRAFPRHGHRGLERSVILCGGLQDEDFVMEVGDFDEADTSRIHSPVALPDEDCWLLASVDGGIQFEGWRGWLQKLIPER